MRASRDKDRDMARSILPSKNRQPARAAKAAITRASRHGVSQDLRAVARLTDVDEWDDRSDLRRDTTIEIRMNVRWRRAGDKLNHFERWAIAVTRDLRPEDRLSAMRARLPRGLIGDHAMSHLRHREELNPDDPWLQRRSFWRQRQQERLAELQGERRRLEHAVRALLETHGGHKALNAAMKAVVADDVRSPCRPRSPHLLRDARGIAAFVAALYKPTGPNPDRARELAALLTLLETERPTAPGGGP